MDGNFINKFLLEIFGIAKGYMTNSDISLSSTTAISASEIMIHDDIVNQFIKDNVDINFISKYSGSLLSFIFFWYQIY